MAVVDAGSTGSRLHIYAIDDNSETKQKQIEELWSHKIKPGFASLEPNAETIDTYLQQLFTEKPESPMPVYFYATAGMRLLPANVQTKYYANLENWFEKQADWELMEARTITGQEEGMFGWLSLNYQLGHLDSNDPNYIGVMDMGGASVQVAFALQDTQAVDPDDLVELTVNGKKIQLFVHSFLGLGQTVFAYQFLNEASCYANQYPLPSGLQGQGDATLCKNEVAKLINDVHDVNQRVQTALFENKPSAWYTMGGIEHLVQDKSIDLKSDFTPGEMFNKGNDAICSQTWSELVKTYPDHLYIHNYCLYPSYYYALMVNGYGISPELPIHLMPKDKSADWAMGVPLHLE